MTARPATSRNKRKLIWTEITFLSNYSAEEDGMRLSKSCIVGYCNLTVNLNGSNAA